MGGGRGVDAPLGASTPWATGRSSLLWKLTRGREGEGRVRPEERGPCPSGDGFTPWRICDLPPQERRRKWEGEGMEGPGRLRRKTVTPVPMGVVRHSGCSTSTPALRQPRASERMWRRREIISVWGSLDHQKCPAIRRYGGVAPVPSLCGIASPKATTVESGEGELRSATRRGGGSGD